MSEDQLKTCKIFTAINMVNELSNWIWDLLGRDCSQDTDKKEGVWLVGMKRYYYWKDILYMFILLLEGPQSSYFCCHECVPTAIPLTRERKSNLKSCPPEKKCRQRQLNMGGHLWINPNNEIVHDCLRKCHSKFVLHVESTNGMVGHPNSIRCVASETKSGRHLIKCRPTTSLIKLEVDRQTNLVELSLNTRLVLKTTHIWTMISA